MCQTCKKPLNLVENYNDRDGLSYALKWLCFYCNSGSKKFSNSLNHKDSNQKEINIRLGLAMRTMSQKDQGAKNLCGLMNLAKPSQLNRCNELLYPILEQLADKSMRKVGQMIKTRDGSQTTISIDGTWQTKGKTSKNGVVVACDPISSKVLDIEILNRYCNICKGK